MVLFSLTILVIASLTFLLGLSVFHSLYFCFSFCLCFYLFLPSFPFSIRYLRTFISFCHSLCLSFASFFFLSLFLLNIKKCDFLSFQGCPCGLIRGDNFLCILLSHTHTLSLSSLYLLSLSVSVTFSFSLSLFLAYFSFCLSFLFLYGSLSLSLTLSPSLFLYLYHSLSLSISPFFLSI